MTSLVELLPVGTAASLHRRITREAVDTFGDLVGDHDRIHFDEEFCRRTAYGRPIAHGALLVGYMSAVSALATVRCDVPLVSLGYDRVRFLAPAFLGDEIEARFVIVEHEEEKGRVLADITVSAGDRLLAVARNILKRSP